MNVVERKDGADATVWRRYTSQIIAVIAKNSVLFVYGSCLGMPALIIPSLSGHDPNETLILDEEGISWIASLNNLSVPLGCLLSGTFAEKLGRKKSLLVVCVPFLVAFLLLHWSSQTWFILLALALTGASGGLAETPALCYATEVSEPKLRGALSSTSTLFICIGILFSMIVGTFWPWRTVALFYALLPLASFIIIIFIPETPYWLIRKARLEEAQKSLAWFRGWTSVENVEGEFREILNHLEEESAIQQNNFCTLNTWKLLMEMRFLKPMLLVLLTFALCHFGITPITVYAVNIFEALQIPISPYYALIIFWCANTLGVSFGSMVLQYLGKRKLSFVCLIGISASFLFVGIYGYLNHIYHLDPNKDGNIDARINWIPLAFIITAGFCNFMLINSLPWILMGEIYYNEIRDAGTGVTAALGYVVIFLANKSFLNLVNFLTLPGVFWFYSGVAICGLVLLYLLLPETEGKPLYLIAEHYNGGKRLSNAVGKVPPSSNKVVA